MKQYSIVGQKHRGLDPYLAGTLPGTPVVLVREPNNKFDPNAVMVWIDGKHVGYIPSKDAAALAPFIDQTGVAWIPPPGELNLALDSGREVRPCVNATFVRSPNSAYPMCHLSE